MVRIVRIPFSAGEAGAYNDEQVAVNEETDGLLSIL